MCITDLAKKNKKNTQNFFHYLFCWLVKSIQQFFFSFLKKFVVFTLIRVSFDSDSVVFSLFIYFFVMYFLSLELQKIRNFNEIKFNYQFIYFLYKYVSIVCLDIEENFLTHTFLFTFYYHQSKEVNY